MTPKKTDDYTAKNLKQLSPMEAVRAVPGMYIGSTDLQGLHHMADEIWANSIDEHLAGHGDKIIVSVTEDNWCTVQDFGRGIPVDINKESGQTGVEMVLTGLHAGGKFRDEDSQYQISGGMHGVGAAVVNALSKEMIATVHKEGYEWVAKFKAGEVTAALKKGKKVSGPNGTTIAFLYDDTVMNRGLNYDHSKLQSRMRELSYLNPGLVVELNFHDHPTETFHSKNGYADFVNFEVNRIGTDPRHKPVLLSAEINDEYMDNNSGQMVKCHSFADIALVWTDANAVDPSQHAFVNIINTYQGGTHVKGAESGLRKVLNEAGQELGKFKAKDEPFSRDDVREGLVWLLMHKLPNPHFASQVKHTLINVEVAQRMEKFVVDEFRTFLLDRKNKETADHIFDRVIEARDNRIHAAKNRKQKKTGLFSSNLPSKLKVATGKNKEENELYLVEGDSAAGMIGQMRDKKTQAVLALKGKVTNIEKFGDKAYESEPLQDIMAALGVTAESVIVSTRKNGRMSNEARTMVDASNINYGKVIICTDADIDGGHIQALLLTFFLRATPSLLRDGKIYIVKPPLYGVEHVNSKIGKIYIPDDAELNKMLKANQIKKNKAGQPMINRFKGLGEMNKAQTKQTLTDRETRQLQRVVVDDHTSADNVVRVLMGKTVAPRKEFIEEYQLTEIADTHG